MTPPPKDAPAELPIWQGRRGVINTTVCCVLAVVCGFGLFFLAMRGTIVPACSAYASAHGMTYKDFNLVGIKRSSTVVCLLAKANGGTQDKRLGELVPVVTDYWVSFAMSLEFTIPGFAILFAIARVWWYGRSIRGAA